jgi:glycosyltransferase involved in cell wall biosynthesis
MLDSHLDKNVDIYLIFRSPVGGLFRHIKDLTIKFNESGYKVGLIFSTQDPLDVGDLEILGEHAKLGITRLKMSRNPSLTDIFVVWGILMLLRQSKGAILHGHGAKGGLYARLASILAGSNKFKAIYTLHGGVLHFDKNRLQGFLYFKIEKWLLKYTGGIIFESLYAKKQLMKILGSVNCKNEIIYNGLASDGCMQVQVKKKFDFIFLGELRLLKGVEYLLKAVQILQKEGRKVSLVLYGAGPDESDLKLFAAKHNISNLSWMGYTSNPMSALHSARCLVVPSLAESLPYVLLEAGIIRVPIIATNVGGIPEILGEKYPMVSPGSSIELASRMRCFLSESEDNAICRAQQVRDQILRKFNIDHMTFKTLAFYANQFNAQQTG